MIRTEQIPDEVVKAAAMQLPKMAGHQRYVRAAIAAALNTWPGGRLDYWSVYDGALLLPMPKEGE